MTGERPVEKDQMAHFAKSRMVLIAQEALGKATHGVHGCLSHVVDSQEQP